MFSLSVHGFALYPQHLHRIQHNISAQKYLFNELMGDLWLRLRSPLLSLLEREQRGRPGQWQACGAGVRGSSGDGVSSWSFAL